MSAAIQAWKDHVARWRYERAQYAARAIAKRKEATVCRARHDFLGALIADGRAREYRATRDSLDAEIKKTCKTYGFR